jgi:hypothetical protein
MPHVRGISGYSVGQNGHIIWLHRKHRYDDIHHHCHLPLHTNNVPTCYKIHKQPNPLPIANTDIHNINTQHQILLLRLHSSSNFCFLDFFFLSSSSKMTLLVCLVFFLLGVDSASISCCLYGELVRIVVFSRFLFCLFFIEVAFDTAIISLGERYRKMGSDVTCSKF